MKAIQCWRYALLSLALGILTLAAATSAGTESGFIPVYNPSLQVPKTTSSIRIDGLLGDPGWRGAGVADNFAEHYPGDQTEPPVETIAYITYDDDYLYVAFVCFDDPALIRTSLSDRDRLYSDDNVGFFFDTYGDASWAYILNANPHGIQADALWSENGGEDNRYDLIWESAARVTDSGYQVELAIPFSSLRFPVRGVQTWKVNFWRNHPREILRQYSWAAHDRNNPCWPCQWGTVTGIDNVRPGGGIELLPTFIAFQSGARSDDDLADSDFANKDIMGELSLGAKYVASSNLTAEATYNPDFSQVESDAAQIEVNTTFALQYPEKRPFFQEGSDLFRTSFFSLYSRTINDPYFAAKATGRFNRTSIACLAAYDEHSPMVLPFEEFSEAVGLNESYSGVVRARQTIGEESHVGIMVTDRRFEGGGAASFLAADASVRLLRNYRLSFQLTGSRVEEPGDTLITLEQLGEARHRETFDGDRHTIGFDGETISGHAINVALRREARHWNWGLDYRELSPGYRADLGFEPRNSRRHIEFSSYYTIYVDSDIIDRISPGLVLAREWNFDKQRKDEWAVGEIGARLKGQTYVSVTYMESWERFRELTFPMINRFHIEIDSDFSEALGAGFVFLRGHIIYRHGEAPVLGSEYCISAWGHIKPLDRLIIEPSYNFDQSRHPVSRNILFKVTTGRARINLQFTRELFLRLIVQYDDQHKLWEFDPLLTYRINPFSLFYIGSTSDYESLYSTTDMRHRWTLSSRQFFLKLQYLFQL